MVYRTHTHAHTILLQQLGGDSAKEFPIFQLLGENTSNVTEKQASTVTKCNSIIFSANKDFLICLKLNKKKISKLNDDDNDDATADQDEFRGV